MRYPTHHILLMLMVFVSGCSSRADIEGYIEETKKTTPMSAQPLPNLDIEPPFAYEASELRSPFKPSIRELMVADNNISPDAAREKEPLELHPLDSLEMVGRIQRDGISWALITDASGLIYRVTTGNHMGKNYGKIMLIEKNSLVLQEIIPDGMGGWKQREIVVLMETAKADKDSAAEDSDAQGGNP